MKLFRLGYAPDAWDDTVNWAKTKSYEWPLVEQARLIIRKEGEPLYDRFRGRLMFPICDEQGRIIGFSGASLPGMKRRPEMRQFARDADLHERKVFFGLDKSSARCSTRNSRSFAKASST